MTDKSSYTKWPLTVKVNWKQISYLFNLKTVTQTRGVSSTQFDTVSPVVSKDPQEPSCEPADPMLMLSTGLPLPDDIPFSMRRVAWCSCLSRSYTMIRCMDYLLHQTLIIIPQHTCYAYYDNDDDYYYYLASVKMFLREFNKFISHCSHSIIIIIIIITIIIINDKITAS